MAVFELFLRMTAFQSQGFAELPESHMACYFIMCGNSPPMQWRNEFARYGSPIRSIWNPSSKRHVLHSSTRIKAIVQRMWRSLRISTKVAKNRASDRLYMQTTVQYRTWRSGWQEVTSITLVPNNGECIRSSSLVRSQAPARDGVKFNVSGTYLTHATYLVRHLTTFIVRAVLRLIGLQTQNSTATIMSRPQHWSALGPGVEQQLSCKLGVKQQRSVAPL